MFKSSNIDLYQGKTPLVNPVRRTAADIFDRSDDTPETHHHKRQKSDMALPLSVPNYPDPPSPDDLLSPAPIADDDMEIDNQHASMDVNVDFTQVGNRTALLQHLSSYSS